jgi:hypothetical protein
MGEWVRIFSVVVVGGGGNCCRRGTQNALVGKGYKVRKPLALFSY